MSRLGSCSSCNVVKKLTRGFCQCCYRQKLKSGKIKYIRDMFPEKLTIKQDEMLTGLMLGDGCLYSPDILKTRATLYVTRAIIDLDYLTYQYDFFKDLCSSGPTCNSIYDNRTNKTYKNCVFRTRRCPLFDSFRKEWYPNDVKIVPKNIKLTPLICAIWFCDDGNICLSKKLKTRRLKLKLSTHGFIKEDTVFLAKYLSHMLCENFFIGNDNGHSFIMAADAATKKFIKYIEPCLPQSMKRKITWVEEDFLIERSRPHCKNRLDEDLNDREIQILSSLKDGEMKSSKEICEEINWTTGKDKKPASSYVRYLDKFKKLNIMIPHKIVLNGKNNTKYTITEKGIKLLNEALSFNSKI